MTRYATTRFVLVGIGDVLVGGMGPSLPNAPRGHAVPMTDDALPDAEKTIEDEDATFDEREIAAEVHLLDADPDVGLYDPGAVADALRDLPEDD